ncbi:tyrosine-type recombinase/integrase [Chitinophaga filiformis]|uniref:tyrosine-type recombinase/integrase n=1 Tax=Chitinophaga filiformis TaxID=104663 RepID=UPI001F376A35|nr:tyrosine-type recombinase/integrase [Chitinophaga filiformis]MCF6405533.1 tyrosine-type recombinase/integrase [Chitinophaga filiformis]MCF6405541.1 tyrosine-type recombinase/integrase [Chitinophaga filiformis]
MTLEQYLQQQYTPSTAASYAREISIFLSGYPEASTAVYKDLMGYIGVLRHHYRNSHTLNRIVSSIKVYYDYLCYTGQRSDHPARGIKLRDRRSRDIQLQDLFSSTELEQLLERKERFNALALRNKVLMSLLIYQGLQVGELAALRVQDVFLESGSVYIQCTAVTNSRTLALKPLQVGWFSSYLQEVRPVLLAGQESELLIIGQRGNGMAREDISKHVKRSYAGMFRGREVSAQRIRQSVIANLFKQGHDIGVVQQFAGHKYPSSTERYRQDDVGRLQAAIELYHPVR